MNVIFLDFDGVLNTYHYKNDMDIERRIKILSEICKETDSKIVVSTSHKECIDEVTLQTSVEWIRNILNLFKKYGIDCIGRTPTVAKELRPGVFTPIWKEDEILEYLHNHPEIEHYCVIDDDDLGVSRSDLNKVRDHLVKTINYSENIEEEGLLYKHKEEVKNILMLNNNFNSKIR